MEQLKGRTEMSKSVYEIDKPESCLKCHMRFVIYEDGKHWQACGLQVPKYGCKTEAFFKDSDLTPGFISSKCPLIDSEKYIIDSDTYQTDTSFEYVATHYDLDALEDYKNCLLFGSED